MKLFVIASLIAITTAGRLEHLERSYLPPTQGGSFGANSGSHGSFGPNSGASGAIGSHGSFGSNGFGSNSFGSSAGRNGVNGNGDSSAFAAATSNQYLPPDQGAAGSSGSSQFSGSLQGFNNQRYQPQRYSAQPATSFGASNQYSIPSTQYGTPQVGSFGTSGNSFGTQAQSPNSFGAQAQSPSSFGAQAHSPSSFGAQGHSPSSFGTQAQGPNSFGAQRYQSQPTNQFGAASRQYLAPKATPSFQGTPQQSFDEETGYHY